MQLAPIDWAVIIGYGVFAFAVGLLLARRAGQDVDQYFLSGRSLPWWMAGTSMVATTFASDTPLVISGWVRTDGIWRNWQWWCFGICGMLTVFLFARYWRRGEVMTTAELAELRYGGRDAGVLRLVQGIFQAGFTNTITLCWVILAAAKIMDVLFEVNRLVAVAIACSLALAYAVLSGFWGVVVTDLVQFAMAMGGAVILAVYAWGAVGGTPGVLEAAASGTSAIGPETLSLLPAAGPGGLLDASFWSGGVLALVILLGVQWWAYDLVDGGGLGVQRIAASRSERDGVLASLWYNVAHLALRPWPWILVAVASLILLPPIEIAAPTSGVVQAASETSLTLVDGAGVASEVAIPPASEHGWVAEPTVSVGSPVTSGQIIAAADPEKAYVVMMRRFLPAGLLGLVIASLLAAFMSTVDTHVNLASSFFVNDVYRRFVRTGASPEHYVRVARIASAGVLAIGGLFALSANSIGDLFTFFLSFLAGVGPVYVLRWLWWRVRAGTEIAAMIASSCASTFITFRGSVGPWLHGVTGWTWPLDAAAWSLPLGPWSDGNGGATPEGRVLAVVAVSLPVALATLVLLPKPRPAELVEFYRRVRPIGAWGPVRELCPEVLPPKELGSIALGTLAGLALVFGLLFAMGGLFLGRPTLAWIAGTAAALGAVGVHASLKKLVPAGR